MSRSARAGSAREEHPSSEPAGGPRLASLPLVGAVAILVVVGLGVIWWLANPEADEPRADPTVRWAATPDPLSPADLRFLAAAVQGQLEDATPEAPAADSRLSQDTGPVFAVLRSGGRWLGSAWASEDNAWDSAHAAVGEARGDLEPDEVAGVDTVELCLSHSYRRLDNSEGLPGDVDSGVLGLQVVHDGNAAAYAPTLMLANNWDFDDVIARFGEAYGVNTAATRSDGRLDQFGCDQVLVSLGDGEGRAGGPAAQPMERGNTVVDISEVTRPSTRALGDRMGAWLAGQVQADGRMVYEWWPSRGEESESNNTIRQWMASLALVRFGLDTNDQEILDLAERNIAYNLRTLYQQDGDLGLVVEPSDGDAKLGAAALAALAISEHPDGQRFSEQEAALRRTVDELWRKDGFFRTFYGEPERELENQNFYPGEALLLWGETYAETRDPELLERFMASFRYYRDWHLQDENRNPAFVPWHTQAYAQVWRVTRDRQLLGFIQEMNDWLLDMQQWKGAPYPDTRGRFYDPDRPQYGVPHASATGVYLEGLAEARRLSQIVGDRERVEQYGVAIRRGLRSVMQLEFADEVDMYYVSQRDRVRGGVRTTVYDNRIRVDNVQHNLLAVINILRWWPGP